MTFLGLELFIEQEFVQNSVVKSVLRAVEGDGDNSEHIFYTFHAGEGGQGDWDPVLAQSPLRGQKPHPTAFTRCKKFTL